MYLLVGTVSQVSDVAHGPLVQHVTLQRRWVILSSQEPTEVQISKLKLKLCSKKQKCILVIVLNLKISYMRFQTAHLNRTLMKKFINMKDTQKCTKYQEI